MAALKYWLWLTMKRRVSNQLRLALLDYFSSPEELYFARRGSTPRWTA